MMYVCSAIFVHSIKYKNSKTKHKLVVVRGVCREGEPAEFGSHVRTLYHRLMILRAICSSLHLSMIEETMIITQERMMAYRPAENWWLVI